MAPPDWERLERLRGRFLADRPELRALPDYWGSDADLAAYDSVFAARIGWKWRAVFEELRERGVDLPGGTVLDWGCGTGIATRSYLACARAGDDRERPALRELLLHDRSPLATAFARRQVAAVACDGGIAVRELATVDPGLAPDLLLVSHALGELDGLDEEALCALAGRSGFVLWVEPGSREVSRRLARIRDRLTDRFDVLAPCTHRQPCGALAAGEQHWCHFFASPPGEVFTDPAWVAIGRRLGIDLRSLPYSFVALRARAGDGARPDPSDAAGEPGEVVRWIGRPDLRNKLARCYACGTAGLREVTVFRSRDPELYRWLKKGSTRLAPDPEGR